MKKVYGSNFVGLNRLGNSRYSASVIPPGLGTMMGHEGLHAGEGVRPPVNEHAKFGGTIPTRVRSSFKTDPNPKLGNSGMEGRPELV